jgi:hypothetical protein
MRAVPLVLSYALAFALQLKKNHGKTSVRLAEKYQLGKIQLVDRGAVIAAAIDCNLQHPWIALRVSQVNPWVSAMSAELPN